MSQSPDAPRQDELDERTAPDDPFVLALRWLAEAEDAPIEEPTAACLATVGADGRPAARMVLVRGADARGFCFYTSYGSRKGLELETRPFAALVWWWGSLRRQIRVEGPVERLSEAESDAYFRARPFESRLAAWAAPQSQTLPSRAVMEARFAELVAEYRGRDVPRPPGWGGYRLRPDGFEFWRGRSYRLHDRVRYTRAGHAWTRVRVAP